MSPRALEALRDLRSEDGDLRDEEREGLELGPEAGAWGRALWGLRRFFARRPLRGACAVAAALGVSLAAGWVIVTWVTWPEVARLATERPETTAFMRRYLEQRATDPDLPPLRHRWVPASRSSVHVKRAVVAAEDLEFFGHDGFSASEMGVAVREALRGERVRGASTITQQLAKNLWLSPSRSPLRKLEEALLTRALEKHVSKERILEIYLNVVELGPGLYGVEAAAQHYFGKPAAELGEREAAMLAATLPRPSSWHPGAASRSYARYVETILGRMERAEFLWKHVSAFPGDSHPRSRLGGERAGERP